MYLLAAVALGLAVPEIPIGFPVSWEEFITVALDEVIPLSGSSIHVHQRIRRMLAELIERAPPERHAALQARLDATAVQSEQL